MTGRILQFTPAHFEVETLLPWYVNGTLDDDRERVEAHLRDCATCRSEVEALRAFSAEYAGEDATFDPAPALGRLRPALGRPRIPWPASAMRRFRSLVRRPKRWLPWVVAQLALIAAIGVLFIDGDRSAAPYRTLGAAEALPHRPGSVVVVFEPGTTEEELRRILRVSDARIVDGPTATGGYVLEARNGPATDVLKVLGTQRAVVLAAWLQGER